MKTLIYYSRAIRPMNQEDLDSLLVQARDFNGAHRITGLLLYQNRSFIQALEGGEEDVDKLYVRILKDKRHTEVTKLYDQEATYSSFAEWSMGFYRVSDHGCELEDLPGYSPILTENFDPTSIDLESEMTFNLLCLFKQYVRNSGTV